MQTEQRYLAYLHFKRPTHLPIPTTHFLLQKHYFWPCRPTSRPGLRLSRTCHCEHWTGELLSVVWKKCQHSALLDSVEHHQRYGQDRDATTLHGSYSLATVDREFITFSFKIQ